jgi:hypothetical protein
MELKQNPKIYDASFDKRSNFTFFMIEDVLWQYEPLLPQNEHYFGIMVFTTTGIYFIKYGIGDSGLNRDQVKNTIKNDWGIPLEARLGGHPGSVFIPIEEIVKPTIVKTEYYTDPVSKKGLKGMQYCLKLLTKNREFEFFRVRLDTYTKEINKYFNREAVCIKDDYVKLGLHLIPPPPKTLVKYTADLSLPKDLNKEMLSQIAQDDLYMDIYSSHFYTLKKKQNNTALKYISENFPPDFKKKLLQITSKMLKNTKGGLLIFFLIFIFSIFLTLIPFGSGHNSDLFKIIHVIGYVAACISFIFIIVMILVFKDTKSILKKLEN